MADRSREAVEREARREHDWFFLRRCARAGIADAARSDGRSDQSRRGCNLQSLPVTHRRAADRHSSGLHVAAGAGAREERRWRGGRGGRGRCCAAVLLGWVECAGDQYGKLLCGAPVRVLGEGGREEGRHEGFVRARDWRRAVTQRAARSGSGEPAATAPTALLLCCSVGRERSAHAHCSRASPPSLSVLFAVVRSIVRFGLSFVRATLSDGALSSCLAEPATQHLPPLPLRRSTTSSRLRRPCRGSSGRRCRPRGSCRWRTAAAAGGRARRPRSARSCLQEHRQQRVELELEACARWLTTTRWTTGSWRTTPWRSTRRRRRRPRGRWR